MRIDAYNQQKAQKPNSFWSRLLDMIAPRACAICGKRLGIEEEMICSVCNVHLPRTDFAQDAYENEMARLFGVGFPLRDAQLGCIIKRMQPLQTLYITSNTIIAQKSESSSER